jgi:diamine N-acetyltransferase
MDISIRKAAVEDLESILKLNKALFDYEEKFNSEYNLGWTYSEKGQNYFRKRIKDDSSIVLVAETGNRIVGYLLIFIDTHSIRKTNPIAEVENMFIDREYRKHGIGTELMKEAIKLIKEKGIKRIDVEVEAQNFEAIKFYKSIGFEDFEITLEMKLDWYPRPDSNR